MAETPLLSAFYFGSVEHYALLARAGRAIMDLGEHYERQSHRTRTALVGPNGKQELVVSIARRSGEKMPMHSVGLSYAEPWNVQHVQAIRTAYGQTPWFIHYMPDVEELLLKKYDRLVDLDLATMRMALKWLKLNVALELRVNFVEETSGLLDLRHVFNPKKPLPVGVPAVAPYQQVFTDRHGFVGRLSILDLLMNTGPAAVGILTRP